MTDSDVLVIQINAIGLLVKAMAYEHPHPDKVLQTFDQLCGSFLTSQTYLLSDEPSRQLFRRNLDSLREVLRTNPTD